MVLDCFGYLLVESVELSAPSGSFREAFRVF